MSWSASPILLILIAVCPGFGQSWESLKDIHPGQKVIVIQTSMQRLDGKFVSANDEAITVDVSGNTLSIPHERVARVSSPSHRVRNALLLGLAAGLAGAFVGKPYHDNNLHDVIPILMAAGGAVAGAAIPSGKTYFRAMPNGESK